MTRPGDYSYKIDSSSALIRLDDTPLVVRLGNIAALVPMNDGRTEVVLTGVGEARSVTTTTLVDDIWAKIRQAVAGVV